MDKDNFFPQIRKGIEDFIQEEEGNISRSKVAMIGSMMVILGVMLADSNIYAAHRSHSSHSSHRSHSSHSSHRSSTHGSHASHSSSIHSSHASGSHVSHSSTSAGIPGGSRGNGAGTVTAASVDGNTSANTSANPYNIKLPKMQTPKGTPSMN